MKQIILTFMLEVFSEQEAHCKRISSRVLDPHLQAISIESFVIDPDFQPQSLVTSGTAS